MGRQVKACVLVAVLWFVSSVSAGLPADTSKSEAELRALVPTLGPLEEKFSKDPEALMGLAATYLSFAPTKECSTEA